MRQLWDNKGSAIIEGMKLRELAAYAQMCGRTLEMLRRADEDRPLVVRLDAELNRLTAREVPEFSAPDRSRAPQARNTATIELSQSDRCPSGLARDREET